MFELLLLLENYASSFLSSISSMIDSSSLEKLLAEGFLKMVSFPILFLAYLLAAAILSSYCCLLRIVSSLCLLSLSRFVSSRCNSSVDVSEWNILLELFDAKSGKLSSLSKGDLLIFWIALTLWIVLFVYVRIESMSDNAFCVLWSH